MFDEIMFVIDNSYGINWVNNEYRLLFLKENKSRIVCENGYVIFYNVFMFWFLDCLYVKW